MPRPKPERETTRFLLQLPKDIHDRLREESQRDYRSMAQIVRDALVEHLSDTATA